MPPQPVRKSSSACQNRNPTPFLRKAGSREPFRNSTEAVTLDAIQQELARLGVTADRLTSEERLQIISALAAGGIFLLKGSVWDVAAGLHCSQSQRLPLSGASQERFCRHAGVIRKKRAAARFFSNNLSKKKGSGCHADQVDS